MRDIKYILKCLKRMLKTNFLVAFDRAVFFYQAPKIKNFFDLNDYNLPIC